MFDHEKEQMEPLAIEYLPNHFPNHVYNIEFQFTDSPGPGRYRADIVVFEYDMEKLNEWRFVTSKASSPPPHSFKKLESMAPVSFEEYKESVTSGYNRGWYGMSESEELAEMIENGYVNKHDDVLHTVSYPKDIVKSVTAIELKKRDVSKALKQAKRYLDHFANHSIVMIDEDRLHLAEKKIDKFRKNGIGLMALSTEGISNELSSTKYFEQESTSWEYASAVMYDLYMSDLHADNVKNSAAGTKPWGYLSTNNGI